MLNMPTPTKPQTLLLPYPIFLNTSLFNPKVWLPQQSYSQLVIITDKQVNSLYGLPLQTALQQTGYDTLLLDFIEGETTKNIHSKTQLEEAMFAHYCDKKTLILALGGGVVGDLAGFVAATFLRGIDYLQLPTSLLAMVDSSVGGKTGINTPQGKNLIGAIYRPKAVVVDFDVLKTLPAIHFTNGLLEAIKMFITFDAPMFHKLIKMITPSLQQDGAHLKEIIQAAISVKAGVIKRDETEQHIRSVLNFGHTIGHALEKITSYQLLHGYAVGYGMLVEAMLAHQLGILDTKSLEHIQSLLYKLGIKGSDLEAYDCHELIETTFLDKKTIAKQVHYVLLKTLGQVYSKNGYYIHPIEKEQVKKAFMAAMRV